MRSTTEESAALAAAVRAVLADAGGTAIAREARTESWRALAGIEATAILVPEHLGGSGLGLCDLLPVLDELGRVVAPLPFTGTAVALGGALALADADPAGIAPGVCDGTLRGALAVLEPGRRTSLIPETRAEGNQLTGHKTRVVGGRDAEILLVSATDEDGIGLWMVRARDTEVTEQEQLDLTTPTAMVALRGAPGVLVLRGDDALQRIVDLVAVARCAEAVGSAQGAFELAMEYTRTREQFGRPIGSFQLVQELAVEMFSGLSLARTIVAQAASALDEQGPDAHREALAARAWCTEHLGTAVGNALQVFAGIGFTWEHDIGLHYKRSLSLAVELGTAEDLLEELADSLLA
jgi:alkylation response protein AidB-like acyl-CoA dehydrogenase